MAEALTIPARYYRIMSPIATLNGMTVSQATQRKLGSQARIYVKTRAEMVLALKAAGLSQSLIARYLNMNPSSVVHLVKKYGQKIPLADYGAEWYLAP